MRRTIAEQVVHLDKGGDDANQGIGPAVRAGRTGTVFDGIAYWVTLVGVYVMVGGLMFNSGREKLFTDKGEAPAYINAQFKGTWISTFPGVDTAWFVLGVLEFDVFVLLLASISTGEFFPHREKSILQVGLSVALLVFALLAFGQTATKQYAGTAELYTYFGVTVVILISSASCRRTVPTAGSAAAERLPECISESKTSRAAASGPCPSSDCTWGLHPDRGRLPPPSVSVDREVHVVLRRAAPTPAPSPTDRGEGSDDRRGHHPRPQP